MAEQKSEIRYLTAPSIDTKEEEVLPFQEERY